MVLWKTKWGIFRYSPDPNSKLMVVIITPLLSKNSRERDADAVPYNILYSMRSHKQYNFTLWPFRVKNDASSISQSLLFAIASGDVMNY